jgi:hypothetical protein
MKLVVARPNRRFLLCCLILLPCTLGLGSVLLCLWRRSFVYRIDAKGIVLWSGRREPWDEILGYNLRMRQGNTASKTSRVDIVFAAGTATIRPGWFMNGEDMLRVLRHNMRKALPPLARMRVNRIPRH